IAPPFLLPPLLQAALAHVVFIHALLIRKVAEFHGEHDAIGDERRSQSGAQAEEEHLASLVAAERLHGCVVDDFHGTMEGALEIEAYPSLAEIVRFGDRAIVQHWTGVADGDNVVCPIACHLANLRHHLVRREGWTGGKPARLILSGDEDLYV